MFLIYKVVELLIKTTNCSCRKAVFLHLRNEGRFEPRRGRGMNLALQYAQNQLFTTTLFAKSTR